MIIDDLLNHGNFSANCPIPVGGYYVHDYSFKTDKIPPVTPLGVYRFDTEILLGDKVIWKAIWVAKLVRG